MNHHGGLGGYTKAAEVAKLSAGGSVNSDAPVKPDCFGLMVLGHLSTPAAAPTCFPFGGTMADKTVPSYLNTTYANV